MADPLGLIQETKKAQTADPLGLVVADEPVRPEPKPQEEKSWYRKLGEGMLDVQKEGLKGIVRGWMDANKAVGSVLEYVGTLADQTEPQGSDITNYIPKEQLGVYDEPEKPILEKAKEPGFVTNIGKEVRKYWEEKAQPFQPEVPGLATADTAVKKLKWAASNIGQMGAQVGVTAPFMFMGGPVSNAPKAATLGGRVLQWLSNWAKFKPMDAPIALLEAGQITEGQLKDLEEGKTDKLHPIRAAAATFLATKLEELGTEKALAKLRFGPDAAKFATKGTFRRIGETAATSGFGESAEEFFQSYAEQFGIDPDDMWTRQQFYNSLEGAAAGLVGGLALGGAGGTVASRFQGKPVEQERPQPPKEKTILSDQFKENLRDSLNDPGNPASILDIQKEIVKEKESNPKYAAELQAFLDEYKSSMAPDDLNKLTIESEGAKLDAGPLAEGWLKPEGDSNIVKDLDVADKVQRIWEQFFPENEAKGAPRTYADRVETDREGREEPTYTAQGKLIKPPVPPIPQRQASPTLPVQESLEVDESQSIGEGEKEGEIRHYYRGGPASAMPNGTAQDVIDYETKELGNNIKVEKNIDLTKIPAKNLRWVTETEEQAKEYGEVGKVEVKGHRIIARDNYGGLLIETTPQPAPTQSKPTKPEKKESPVGAKKTKKADKAITDETEYPYYKYFTKYQKFLPLLNKMRKGQDLTVDPSFISFVQKFNEDMDVGNIPMRLSPSGNKEWLEDEVQTLIKDEMERRKSGGSIAPVTITLSEEDLQEDGFIKEEKLDEIIETATINIQGIKEELYEEGYSNEEIATIIRGIEASGANQIAGREFEERLAALKEQVRQARVQPKPIESTGTGGELFNTSSMFSLSGNQPTVTKTFKPNERKGERLFDVQKQSTEELQERLSGEKAVKEYEAEKGYGKENKVFTEDKANKARELLRKKLNQLNVGIDPEILSAGIDLAGYHIEAGARKFADYSTRMVNDIGEKIRPYLKSFYLAVRNYPGFDNKGMETEAELEKGETEKPVDKEAKPPLRTFVDTESNLNVQVTKVDKGYSVVIQDIDSKEYLNTVKIYPTEAEAINAAQLIAAGKKASLFVPKDDWRNNLIKAREYATALQIPWEGDWTKEQLVEAIDKKNEPAKRPQKSPLLSGRGATIPLQSQQIASSVKTSLLSGTPITREMLFSWANDAYGGTMAEGKYQAKDAYDALEMGINQYIYDQGYAPIMNTVKRTTDSIDLIRNDILDKIPSQSGLRSEEQDEFQQFSTPPDLAYTMAWVADIGNKDTVLEPSAGIGGIAIFARNADAKVIVNELSARRSAILKEMGIFDTVYTENAEQIYNILHKKISPTVVLMNPPFSSTAGRIQGQRKSSNVVQHLDQALKLLQPNGRMVALIGKGWFDDPRAVSEYFEKIKQNYNLHAIITIGGKGYAKYGTTYDNRILVIDKSAPENKPTLEATVEDVKDAIPLLKEVRDARAPIIEQRTPESKGETVSSTGEATGRPVQPVLPATGKVGAGQRPEGAISGTGNIKSNAPVETGTGNEPVGEGESTRPDGAFKPSEWPEGTNRPRVGGTRSASGSLSADFGIEQGAEQGLKVEVKESERAKEELTDSVYESYTPQKLTIKNAKGHPGKLVESAAMSVVTPPDPSYSPKIPESVIKSGQLSLAQLEAIVYAGQAHQQMLTTPVLDDNGKAIPGKFYRKGYFIGDGTGVGKGREIAGIIRDNFNQGRKKAIWISQNAPLINDAKRDIKGTGWESGLVFDVSKKKLSADITEPQGIAFLGYDLLKSKDKKKPEISRLNQIVKWFGKDFDGVIVFDESHNMGNAIAVRGVRGTSRPAAKAIAGMELQRLLPNARVVYVSATGATEVMNLAYADRLGLWGEGTPFASKQDFVGQIASGGIAAMEFVARDMKAMGNYLSRSLSYEDVKYEHLEHKLTDEQRVAYDKMADAWQMVLARIDEALGITGGAHSGNATSAAKSAFWGAELRFFNHVITSMQTVAVVNSIEKDLKKGHAVILQIVDTNEAAEERALAKMEEGDELEDLDTSPLEQLMQYVHNSFPVAQYQEVTDPNDHTKTIWVPVLDSNGAPVENPEAVEKREQLLIELGGIARYVPNGALDMIIDHFGPEKVAEITGRKRRVITVEDEQGRHKIIEKRSESKTMADADAYMADKKQILIFSYKGGTGRSYHADLAAENQRLRRHYLLQAGWRADRAIQGFGRSHRSSQKQAPEYILVTTDIIGQKRFISSIARRLDQLGALTRGQRETGSGGFFTARDNLESVYAEDAVNRLVHDIYHHQVEGWDIGTFMQQAGLPRLIDDRDGSLNERAIPPVTQFMNRLLAMNLDRQVELFGHFSERLDANIRTAMARGTLDVGLETLKAKKIEKVSEQIVHTDEKSGAETKYVQLNVTRDSPRYEYEQIKYMWGDAGFYRNIKSGQVWAASGGKTKTDATTGHISTVHRLRGPKGTIHEVDTEDLHDKEKYELLQPTEAETSWTKEYDELPETVTYQEHFVTGALLPIWDRLSGRARIMRVQTDEGERMIGRLIAPDRLPDTLRKLGATLEQQSYTPEEIFSKIKDHGFSVELSNDWKIKRKKIANETRIEITGPDYRHMDELKRHGVFVERVNWETRYFIPTTNEGIETIRAITASRPVVNTIAPLSTREDLGTNPQLKLTTASDLASFSFDTRPPSTPRFSVAQVEQFIAGALHRWGNIGEVKVIKTTGDLPARFMRYVTEGEKVLGAYDEETDTTYIIADSIANARAAIVTLVHEAVGHRGIHAVLGPVQEKVVFRKITEAYQGTPLMDKLVRTYGLDMTNDIDRRAAASELLAHLAETREKPSLWKQIVGFIRDALRKVMPDLKYTDADITYLLQRARRFSGVVEKGKTGQYFKKDLSEETPKQRTLSIADILAQAKKEAGIFDDRMAKESDPPPPDAPPEKVKGWFRRETGILFTHLSRTIGVESEAGKFMEKMLKSPEWWTNPVLRRIVHYFADTRSEAYHEYVYHLNNIDGKEVIKATEEMQKKSPEKYKQLMWAIDYGDTSWKRGKESMDRLHDTDISREARLAVVANQVKKYEEFLRSKGLPEDVIDLWKLHRASYDRALDLMTEQMREMIAELEEQAAETGQELDDPRKELLKTLKGYLANMEEWRGFYAPRMRQPGDWELVLKKGEDKIRLHGSSFQMERTWKQLEAEGWKPDNEALKKGESPVQRIKRLPEEIYQSLKTVDVSKAITYAMERSKDTAEVTAAFNDEVLELVSDMMKARGFRSTMIHRMEGKVMKGYEEDPLIRFIRYSNNISSGLAKAKVARLAYEEVLGTKNEKGEREGGLHPIENKQDYLFAKRYIEFQLRNLDFTDRLIGLAKSLATFKFLGLNPRSILVNLTALSTTAPASVHQYAGNGKVSMSKVMKEIVRASKDAAQLIAKKQPNLAEHEKAYIEKIIKEGWDDPQYARDAMGAMQKTQLKWWNKTMSASMWAFGKSEQLNRLATLLAGYRIAYREAIKAGMSEKAAIEKAEHLAKSTSDKAHGIYGKATLPMIAQLPYIGKIGQLMYVYGKFGHNYVQMLYDLGANQHNWKAFLWGLISPIVLAGGTVLPFKDALWWLVGAVLKTFGIGGDPEKSFWDWVRKQFGKQGEKFGRYGLMGGLGVDISGSLSVGVDIPKNWSDIGGAPWGVIEDVMKAGHFAATGRPGRAAEKVLPTGLANIARAFRENRQGVTTERGYRVFTDENKPYKPSLAEMALQMGGFRSAEKATLSERVRESKREKSYFDEKKKGIYEEYRGYLADPNRTKKEHDAIVKKVSDFNRQLRQEGVKEVSRITFEQMRIQAKRMQKPTRAQRRLYAE